MERFLYGLACLAFVGVLHQLYLTYKDGSR